MSSFISDMVAGPCFCSQPGKRFALVKNVIGAAEYAKVINCRLISVILGLKRSYCTFLYSKRGWRSIFDIFHSGERFSPKNKMQMRVKDHSLSTFNNCLHKTFNKAVLLLSMRWGRIPDYTCFFKVLGCSIGVKFTKISVKNANPDAILSIDTSNKILKGGKSIWFFFQESDLDMTRCFVNKKDKVAISSKSGIGLSSSS